MKQLSFFLLLLFTACGKTEHTDIDCLGESNSVKFEYAQDPANARKFDYTISYTGDIVITSITFDYGDGKTESLSVLKGTHTYTQPGSYIVKATLTLQNSTGVICAITPAKNVTIY
ncbi:PKD domain-containing protein [Chitinophaga sp. sic0106]|uniref:PKD domain-containing protein n=1 Tax=Chitinophaga sp. sic0106 TaxID=2854785 RepID=UPI001C467CB4|nr:PKD domain-containing protein [Chitinophaga sp. sic0106]MBV7532497.1 PKD domain-containing protein [Chitinophaga sp. sic0106]